MARQVKSGSGQSGAKTIHVLNGPNLNLLGEREPQIYGMDTLADVERLCREAAKAAGFSISFSQTNSEAELIDQIQAARASAGIVLGYRFAVQAVCLRGGRKPAKRLGANAN